VSHVPPPVKLTHSPCRRRHRLKNDNFDLETTAPTSRRRPRLEDAAVASKPTSSTSGRHADAGLMESTKAL
jgi:hypothetical protein